MGWIENSVIVLGTHVGTGAGTALDLDGDARSNLAGRTVTLIGFTTATVSLQVSPDGGTTWVIAKDNAGNVITATADAMFVIGGNATQVRSNCSAWTSGTIVVRLLP